MKNLIILCAACGVGKSTIKDALSELISNNYACIDTDEVGLNWWNYAGTERESEYNDDCLAEAVKMSGDKNLLFASCMNPYDFYGKVRIPQDITATFFIAMTCSAEEITARLKARPAERMCGSNEFIATQIDYNDWFKSNSNKFQFYIDNTKLSIEETAKRIAEFINSIYE